MAVISECTAGWTFTCLRPIWKRKFCCWIPRLLREHLLRSGFSVLWRFYLMYTLSAGTSFFISLGCQLSQRWAAAVEVMVHLFGSASSPTRQLQQPFLIDAHSWASNTWEEDRHRQMLSSFLPKEPAPFLPDIHNKLSVWLLNSPLKCDNENRGCFIWIIFMISWDEE